MNCVLVLACCLAAAYDDSSIVSRSYAGLLSDVDADAQTPVMEFNVTCIATQQPDTTQLDFLVVQDVASALPWHARFGRQTQRAGESTAGRAIEIQLEYDGSSVVRALPPLLVPLVELEEGYEWTDGEALYSVIGAETVEGRVCWVIEANNRIGYLRMMHVDQASGAVVAAHERVFFGQGDEFALDLILSSEQTIESDAAGRNAAVAARLIELQTAVGDSLPAFPKAAGVAWEEAITELQALSADTSYANLVAGMSREYVQAQRQAASVAELADAMVGQPAPAFALELLGGGESNAESRAGQIIILHFWEYRDEPLVEPYGQVGYLDFLSVQFRDDPVTVLGVAVNQQLAATETRPAAARSIRALKQFMNLGYPIGLDSGEVLDSFGDPREAGAELPLWLVIDSQGRVVHYHAGHYEIDVNRGLEELETKVRNLLAPAP